MKQPDDNCLPAPIPVKILNGIAQTALMPQATKNTLKVTLVVNDDRLIYQASERPTDKSRHRDGYACDCPNTTRQLFNIDARIS